MGSGERCEGLRCRANLAVLCLPRGSAFHRVLFRELARSNGRHQLWRGRKRASDQQHGGFFGNYLAHIPPPPTSLAWLATNLTSAWSSAGESMPYNKDERGETKGVVMRVIHVFPNPHIHPSNQILPLALEAFAERLEKNLLRLGHSNAHALVCSLRQLRSQVRG